MAIIFIFILALEFICLIWIYVRGRQTYFCINDPLTKTGMAYIPPYTIIITAKEGVDIIKDCIASIPKSNIILALDHPSKSLLSRLKKTLPDNVTIIPNYESGGKTPTQAAGIRASKTELIILLDADIRFLIPEVGINEMILALKKAKADFLCPFSTAHEKGRSALSFIQETDRIYRQRIIRCFRDSYGISNLTGYCLVADKIKYLDILENHIQDDVICSFNMIAKDYKVITYPVVVCSELERPSIYSYFMQRVRWTQGNLKLLSRYVGLMYGPKTKLGCIFFVSFCFWYFVFYLELTGCLFATLTSNHFSSSLLFLCLSLLVILRAVMIWLRSYKKIPLVYAFLHSALWPLFLTMCLIASFPYKLFGLEQKSRRK